jgi:hypothetical protein
MWTGHDRGCRLHRWNNPAAYFGTVRAAASFSTAVSIETKALAARVKRLRTCNRLIINEIHSH